MSDLKIAIKKIKARLSITEQLLASFGDVDDLDEQERDALCFENGKTKAYEESIYELEMLNHIVNNNKMVERKLKPVDENCLYKPVLTAKGGAIYVGKNFEDEYMVNRKDFVLRGGNILRLPDYDYGDGGNYL